MERILGSLGIALPVALAIAAAGVGFAAGRPSVGLGLAALGGALIGAAVFAFLRSTAVLLGVQGIERGRARRRLVLLERDKDLALRSIQEIEFDASLQRLPADEAARLAAPLRERALVLLREIDRARATEAGSSSVDDQIRAEVARRIESRRAAKKEATGDGA